ncbi:hypothetical protein GCM10010921_07810 [Microbacterium album]|uniref:Phosphoribosyltransferase domain-containing protein n=1 Tax=Microbacterium album TaxID=2053191 RepID=A0A917IC55_9MICO|nr:hypothetical protein GCM10010921_07810 [Microbacterium album]
MGTTRLADVAGATRRALEGALALALPVACAGCGASGVDLCAPCAARLRPDPRCRAIPGGLAVWSGLVFDGEAARAVRALKERGRTDVALMLAPALRAAVSAALAGRRAPVVAVPVPTSRAALRRRGYRVPELVARRAGARTTRLLVAARPTRDQRGLGRAERERNAAGSMRVRGRAAGLEVLLVDDVVTTGATLAEAARFAGGGSDRRGRRGRRRDAPARAVRRVRGTAGGRMADATRPRGRDRSSRPVYGRGSHKPPGLLRSSRREGRAPAPRTRKRSALVGGPDREARWTRTSAESASGSPTVSDRWSRRRPPGSRPSRRVRCGSR